MSQFPYAFRQPPPSSIGNTESVVADNGPNNPALINSIGNTTRGADMMPGVYNPNNFNSSVPVSGMHLPGAMPVHPGPGVAFMPPGQKIAGFPSPGQGLVSNPTPMSGDASTQRVTPQPLASYASNLPGGYGPPTLAANGLSPPGDGFNRSNSAPPQSFQANGPPTSVGLVTRPPLSGLPIQPPYMMPSINQPGLTARPGMMDGVQPTGFGSPSPHHYPSPPRMGMPYRGAVPPGPPPSGSMLMGGTPPGMPQMVPPMGSAQPRAPHMSSPPSGTPPVGLPHMQPPSGTAFRGPPPMAGAGGTPPRMYQGPPQQPPAVAPPPMMHRGTSQPGPPPHSGLSPQRSTAFAPPPMAAGARGSHLEQPTPGVPLQSMSTSSVGNSMSDSASESTSQQSSRTGSPTNHNSLDDMEGQFVGPPYQGGGPYSSVAAPGQRPIMPPTSFPGPPPTQFGPAPGQPVNSFMPPQPTARPTAGYPTNNYQGSLNSSMNRLHLQPDHSMPMNLLQERNILPSTRVEPAEPNLPSDLKRANCSSDIMTCTINAIPNTQSLLNKSRLPLGILIHPFKDLSQLPVVQSSVIVRCRSCRTYINPFVSFVDAKRWRCNLCFRNNDLPDDFNYDPVSKTYGDPQRRPEIRSSTIEFVAPSEYMLRPPQPAVYMYLLDVSFNAIETGYLQVFCQSLIEELDSIPGDSRLQIGFITYDSSLHFYNLAEELTQPHMYIVSDLEEVELPSPDSLLVNLQESKSLVLDLLTKLPQWFEKNLETGSALGPALQAAFKMMSPTGGRVTVVQTHLPTIGAGALKSREDPNERAGKNVQNLGPVTDFYKKLALDCSAQQIAVDLFMLNSQYADIATLAGASKYSGGCLYFFPGFHTMKNPTETERFESTLRRYFTRKIGFEAVMRIRCTRGVSINTFHGNFFVRSTDLLSLPNVNPDAGYGVQMSIDETLESNYVSFQAALLYTSSKAERRIRVHTLCLPITSSVSEIISSANQLAIVGLLAKMAVDKSLSASLSDAREAMINAAVDMISAYGSSLSAGQRHGQLPCPYQLRLIPLYVLAMLKSSAFRVGTSTKLDDRVFAMEQCKNLPLRYLVQMLHPDLYPVHSLDEKNAIYKGDKVIVQPPILPLSSAHIDRHGAYLMDSGSEMYLWLGAAISDQFCNDVLGVPSFQAVTDGRTDIPKLDNPTSQTLHQFVQYLNEQRPVAAPLTVLREDSRSRSLFLQHLIEDRTESTLSYVEFLQHIQKEVKS